jgi:hypothetical protein
MKKGSHKVVTIPEANPEMKPSTAPHNPSSLSTEELIDLPLIDSMLNILLRICDACHDIDSRTEPWVSIRRDIQRLK